MSVELLNSYIVRRAFMKIFYLNEELQLKIFWKLPHRIWNPNEVPEYNTDIGHIQYKWVLKQKHFWEWYWTWTLVECHDNNNTRRYREIHNKWKCKSFFFLPKCILHLYINDFNEYVFDMMIHLGKSIITFSNPIVEIQ